MFELRTLHCSESSCWECDLDSDGVTVWHWDRWHALTWHNLSSLKIITSSLHCFMAFNCHFRNWKRQSTSFHQNSLVAYFRTGRTSIQPSYCNISTQNKKCKCPYTDCALWKRTWVCWRDHVPAQCHAASHHVTIVTWPHAVIWCHRDEPAVL